MGGRTNRPMTEKWGTRSGQPAAGVVPGSTMPPPLAVGSGDLPQVRRGADPGEAERCVGIAWPCGSVAHPVNPHRRASIMEPTPIETSPLDGAEEENAGDAEEIEVTGDEDDGLQAKHDD